jgi:hypothetical protein
MALVACNECGHPVARTAAVCPGCGKRRQMGLLARLFRNFVVGMLLIGGGCWYVGHKWAVEVRKQATEARQATEAKKQAAEARKQAADARKAAKTAGTGTLRRPAIARRPVDE